MNGCRFDNECFIIIDTRLLRETTNDPSGFVARKRTIRIVLMPKYPFATDNVGTRRRRDKCPSFIQSKCIVLFLHGMSPIRISKGGEIAVRDRGRSNGKNI